jgi:hypothetical protein
MGGNAGVMSPISFPISPIGAAGEQGGWEFVTERAELLSARGVTSTIPMSLRRIRPWKR